MEKYYKFHDEAYQQQRKKGFKGWNSEKLDVDNSGISPYLREYLENEPRVLSVLDLGTGAGNSALFVAKFGHKVLGLELSPTAIEMARENAKELSVDVEFRQEDICKFRSEEKFDLILDSSLLHCIVLPEDRKAFFETLKANLKENGKAVIFTMVQAKNMSKTIEKEVFRFDEDGILWCKVFPGYEGMKKEIEGEDFYPQRLITTAKKMREEILSHGFKIESEIVRSAEHGIPNSFFAFISL